MTAAVNQDFTTYAGDDVSPVFTVRQTSDSTSAVIDISTVTEITWTAWRTADDVAATLTKKKSLAQISFVNTGTDGKFQVAITKTDTTPLEGYYIHRASITDNLGNVTTVTVGRMTIGPVPVWTYDPGQLSSSALYQVRRLVGDVLQGDPQLADAEVNFAISLYSNIYLQAAECCRQIAAQYSRKVDTVQGELRTLYSTQQRAYAQRAGEYEARGLMRGGALPFGGGISKTDKENRVEDTDRVPPSFNVGMFDDVLLGTTGNQTPEAASPNFEPGSGGIV